MLLQMIADYWRSPSHPLPNEPLRASRPIVAANRSRGVHSSLYATPGGGADTTWYMRIATGPR